MFFRVPAKERCARVAGAVSASAEAEGYHPLPLLYFQSEKLGWNRADDIYTPTLMLGFTLSRGLFYLKRRFLCFL